VTASCLVPVQAVLGGTGARDRDALVPARRAPPGSPAADRALGSFAVEDLCGPRLEILCRRLPLVSNSSSMREYSICAMANGSLPSMSGRLRRLSGLSGRFGASAAEIRPPSPMARADLRRAAARAGESRRSFWEAKSAAEPNQPRSGGLKHKAGRKQSFRPFYNARRMAKYRDDAKPSSAWWSLTESTGTSIPTRRCSTSRWSGSGRAPGFTSGTRARCQRGRLHHARHRRQAGDHGAPHRRTIRVLMNRCAHKGTKWSATWRAMRQDIPLPYHAWTYRTDGSLINIPLKEGYDGTALKRDGLGWRR